MSIRPFRTSLPLRGKRQQRHLLPRLRQQLLLVTLAMNIPRCLIFPPLAELAKGALRELVETLSKILQLGKPQQWQI